MIGILIVWFIIGIVLIFSSGLLYYGSTIGLEIFLMSLLVGFAILVAMVLQIKKKDSGQLFSSLKNVFKIIAVITIIIFLIGVLGYLLVSLRIITSDFENTTTELLVFGSIIFLLSLISYIYVEKILPVLISKKISEQQRALAEINEEYEAIGTNIKSLSIDMNKCMEDSIKTGEKNREALMGR